MRPVVIGLISLSCLLFFSSTLSAEKCTVCHKEEQRFSKFHSPYVISCEMCHGGNPEAELIETAHLNLEAYPGNMKTVGKYCGQAGCHADLVPMVENSIMNTLDGMISVTRNTYKENRQEKPHLPLRHRLKNSGADQYLRKLCVSCHLGNKRKNHSQSFRDRGGGCPACHLQTFKPEKTSEKVTSRQSRITGVGKIHPALTIQISNDRCLGCHSRSGRISLNYRGLAEVEQVDKKRVHDFAYLYDKRLVEKKKPDLHHIAGMACIDCHTAAGLMGTGKRVKFLREQTDIQCLDCHATNLKSKKFDQPDFRESKYLALYQGRLTLSLPRRVYTTGKMNSPLLHIRQNGSKRLLQSKVTGKILEIPVARPEPYHSLNGHERLTCDSCHTGWAPLCYGCHVSYNPDGKQFDHLKKKKTSGRWIEKRWYIKNELPALGVTYENKITTFIPGMNLTIKKTPQAQPFDQLIFSAISAHTTQAKARSCKSCHQNDAATGIIQGQVTAPRNSAWKTSVGWIREGSKSPGMATKPGDRSLSSSEIERIRRVGRCLNCHQETESLYSDFKTSLKKKKPACLKTKKR